MPSTKNKNSNEKNKSNNAVKQGNNKRIHEYSEFIRNNDKPNTSISLTSNETGEEKPKD